MEKNVLNRSKFTTGNFYENSFIRDFPLGSYFINEFDKIPKILNTDTRIDEKIVNWFEGKCWLMWESISLSKETHKIEPHSKVFRFDTLGLGSVIIQIFFYKNMNNPKMEFEDYSEKDYIKIICAYDNERALEEILDKIKEHQLKEENINNINLITKSTYGLKLQRFSVKLKDEIDLGLNYGKDFIKVNDLIINTLSNKKSKGLILLHGKPGTGKTTYIRHLAKTIDKKIIFVPPFMVETIASPDFIPFLMENPDSLLIIEDAERVITDRSVSASVDGVSNILNLTDGILGDCLNIQVLATFNTDKERIDKALLRKGRLVVDHAFHALNKKDAQELINHLNIKTKAKGSMTLADIYTFEEEIIRSSSDENKIGFITYETNDK